MSLANNSWLDRRWLPEPRPVSPAFSSWLDCLRWVAAALVCITHVRSAMFADYDPAAGSSLAARGFYLLHGYGHQAVVVFFVLSGFLVGGEVLRGLQRAEFDWSVYAIRRVSRLYPVYLAALLLGALWDNLGLHFFNVHQLYSHAGSPFPMIFYPVVERLTLTVLGGNLLFCQDILVPTFGSNSPLWSLANEAWYYALFPLFLWPWFSTGPRRGRLIGLALFAAGVWFLPGVVLTYFSLWVLGAGLRFLPRRLIGPAWLPPLLFATMFLLGRLHWLDGWMVFQRDLLLALLLALWLNALEHQSTGAPGKAVWHQRLAGFSYSFYLVHWPLGLFLTAVLEKLTGHGYRMGFGVGAVLIYGAVLAFLYVFAWLVAQVTERRTARIREKLLALIPRGAPAGTVPST